MNKVVISICIHLIMLIGATSQTNLRILAKIPNGALFGGIQGRVDHPAWMSSQFLLSPFIIDDLFSKKTLWLDCQFQVAGEMEIEWKSDQSIWTLTTRREVVINRKEYFIYGYSTIWGFDGKQKANIGSISFDNPDSGARSGIFVYDYIFCNDGKDLGADFHSFVLPSKPGEAFKRLETKQIQALFSSSSNWSHPGLEIDIKNRLFLNGEILTRDLPVFINYFIEKNGRISIAKTAKASDFDPSKGEYRYDYLGRDLVGNWYWGPLVFSSNGDLIYDDTIDFRSKRLPVELSEGRVLSRGMDGSGDIYYLYEHKNEILLMRQENTWAPQARKLYAEARAKGLYAPPPLPETAKKAIAGTVNDDVVRLRTDRGTGSESIVIAIVSKGTRVEVLARSNKKETIGASSAYWYIVRLPDKRRGWMYGAFVDVAGPDSLVVNDWPYERTVFNP